MGKVWTRRVRALAKYKEREERRINKNLFPPPEKKCQISILCRLRMWCNGLPVSAFCTSGAVCWMGEGWRILELEEDDKTKGIQRVATDRTLPPFSPTIHCEHTRRETKIPPVFPTAYSSHETPRQHSFQSAGKFQLLPVCYGKVLLCAPLQHNRRNRPIFYPRFGFVSLSVCLRTHKSKD